MNVATDMDSKPRASIHLLFAKAISLCLISLAGVAIVMLLKNQAELIQAVNLMEVRQEVLSSQLLSLKQKVGTNQKSPGADKHSIHSTPVMRRGAGTRDI